MVWRYFKESDYAEISNWFVAHGWPQAPHISMLPKTGLIVENDTGKALAVGFLYKTDSPIAFFEWVATCPHAGYGSRKALIELFGFLKHECQKNNIARVLHMTHAKFSKFLQKHIGFKFSETAELLFLNTEGAN